MPRTVRGFHATRWPGSHALSQDLGSVQNKRVDSVHLADRIHSLVGLKRPHMPCRLKT